MNARQFRKVVPQKFVEMVDRSCEYLEHIIAVARGGVAFDDRGVGDDGCLELDMRVEIDPHFDKALHLEAERRGVEACRVAVDDPLLFEIADPRPAG